MYYKRSQVESQSFTNGAKLSHNHSYSLLLPFQASSSVSGLEVLHCMQISPGKSAFKMMASLR